MCWHLRRKEVYPGTLPQVQLEVGRGQSEEFDLPGTFQVCSERKEGEVLGWEAYVDGIIARGLWPTREWLETTSWLAQKLGVVGFGG